MVDEAGHRRGGGMEGSRLAPTLKTGTGRSKWRGLVKTLPAFFAHLQQRDTSRSQEYFFSTLVLLQSGGGSRGK